MAKYLELTREVINSISRRREAEKALGGPESDRKTPSSPTTPESGPDSEWEGED